MHELVIATNIVRIASRTAGERGAGRVTEVVVDIGRLSGVVKEALEFAWESARKGTMLEPARLVINHLPGKAQCSSCGYVYPVDHLFIECPVCRSFNPVIIQGRELSVKSILIEEEE